MPHREFVVMRFHVKFHVPNCNVLLVTKFKATYGIRGAAMF